MVVVVVDTGGGWVRWRPLEALTRQGHHTSPCEHLVPANPSLAERPLLLAHPWLGVWSSPVLAASLWYNKRTLSVLLALLLSGTNKIFKHAFVSVS